jgi:hypothetical protein
MAWEPEQVVFGIRHKRLFGFLGHAGDSIDALLRLPGTGPFPQKCLTRISWPNQVTARIEDDEEHFVVECNIDGVVLMVDLQELEMTRDQVRDAFIEVANTVLGTSGGNQYVNRIGIMCTYIMRHRSPGTVALRALTRLDGIENPVDVTLKTSFRTPTEAGLVRGDVNDWKNTILQIESVKRDEDSEVPDAIKVSVDYQIYFDPERAFLAKLVEDHNREFQTRIERLQQVQLAGLAEEPRAE